MGRKKGSYSKRAHITEEMIDDSLEFASKVEAAKHLGISLPTYYTMLRERGIALSSKVSVDEVAKVLAYGKKHKITATAVAKHLGISRQAISEKARKRKDAYRTGMIYTEQYERIKKAVEELVELSHTQKEE